MCLGGDIEIGPFENRLRAIRVAALTSPTRAFIFNLQSVDHLLHSPFLIAADGVGQFYWTLKYIGAGKARVASVLNGEMSPDSFVPAMATKINEAEWRLREFLATPKGLEEFAEQIDARLKGLAQRKDFQTALRVQLLSAIVLLWTTYETLRNHLQLIAKTHSIPRATLSVSEAEVDQLARLKEYRNVIVHNAGIVDERLDSIYPRHSSFHVFLLFPPYRKKRDKGGATPRFMSGTGSDF